MSWNIIEIWSNRPLYTFVLTSVSNDACCIWYSRLALAILASTENLTSLAARSQSASWNGQILKSQIWTVERDYHLDSRITIRLGHANIRVAFNRRRLCLAQRVQILDRVRDVLDGERQNFHAHTAQVGRGHFAHQCRKLVSVLIDSLDGHCT